MKRYPAYKDSGVEWIGEVPEHWEVTKVKFLSVTPVQYGLNISAESYTQEGVRFIRTTDIDDFGNIIEDGVYLPEHLVGKEYILQSGDLLISRSGTVGRAYVHLTDKDQFTYAGYLVRFTFNELSIAKFLFYFTKASVFSIWLESTSVESTIANVNGQKYANLFVALPVNGAEQRAIAAYLDRKTAQIDTLIANKRRRVELLTEERTAVISHAVTKGLDPDVPLKESGVEWIGEIPVGWETKKIKYLGQITGGYAFKSDDFKSYDTGCRVLKISNIQTMTMDWTEESFVDESYYEQLPAYRLHQGNLVFALTRPIISTGIKAAMIRSKEKILLNQRNAVFQTSTRLIVSWIYYVLFSAGFVEHFESLIDTTGQQPNISTNDIANIYIPLPPDGEQRAIAAYLDEKTAHIDRAIAHAEQQIALLEEYRTALISAAVTGKIDVREGRTGG